jgi:hypothetical protein
LVRAYRGNNCAKTDFAPFVPIANSLHYTIHIVITTMGESPCPLAISKFEHSSVLAKRAKIEHQPELKCIVDSSCSCGRHDACTWRQKPYCCLSTPRHPRTLLRPPHDIQPTSSPHDCHRRQRLTGATGPLTAIRYLCTSAALTNPGRPAPPTSGGRAEPCAPPAAGQGAPTHLVPLCAEVVAAAVCACLPVHPQQARRS